MATPELAPGTVLAGSYEIVRRIGAGGMGAVYEARHLRLADRHVAVKVLLRDLASDAEVFARFRREAEIGARLGHPHIVSVTDWDSLPDGSPFLVMELLPGEDLAQRMLRGAIPAVEALRIVREVGSALAAAHRSGIVHRDLKPQNVFLVPVEEPGGVVARAKVLDFGISKIAASQTVVTRESVILGTPQYMAPEQALGEASKVDARTDQFALASMAYEMLARRPAFVADSVTAVLFKVVYEAPPPLARVAPQVATAVAQVIERAMAKDRDARYPDVMAFLSALEAAASGGAEAGGGASAGPVGAGGAGGAVSGGGPTLPAFAEETPPSASGEVLATPSLVAAMQHAQAPSSSPVAFVAMQQAAPGGGGRWRLPAAVGVVAAVLLGVGLSRMRTAPGDRPAANVPVVVRPAAPPSTVPPAVGVTGTGGQPPPEAMLPRAVPPPTAHPSSPPVDARPAPVLAHHPSSPATPAPAVAEPPAVAAALDDAERLLDAGRGADAIARARQTLGIAPTPRAHAIIFTGYCQAGDLGNARAALFHVPAARKPALRKRCHALGLDL